MMLNNRKKIQRVGLGTYLNHGNTLRESIHHAISFGYRSIDTASFYGNESDVGAALNEAEIDINDMWVTSKLWNDSHGYDRALKAFEESEKKLGKIDCYLIHWPGKDLYVETWKALERLYEEKRIKAIGVCNFLVEHLDKIILEGSIIPAINQIESHLYFMDTELIKYCHEHVIVVEAWRPLMHGLELFSDRVVIKIAEKHHVDPAQVALKYLLQKGLRVIPKSTNELRIKHNITLYNFTLSDFDMLELDTLNHNNRTGPHPNEFF